MVIITMLDVGLDEGTSDGAKAAMKLVAVEIGAKPFAFHWELWSL